MQKALQSRFTKVAKGFGKGIASIFTKGGPIGLALGLITKLLNPLENIQEAMDKTLASAGSIVTNSEQFGTTPGQLAKLTALGQAKGIDQDSLYMLINKFQGAVAQAEADPGTPSAVRQYVGQKDTAEGFFEFIQALQGMDRNQQLLVQQQVFGEKQILKMAEFLQADFKALLKAVAPQSASSLTKSLNNLDSKEDLAGELGAARGLRDLQSKGRIITENMIRQRDKAERIALAKENKQIQSYDDLAAISNTMASVMGLVEQGIAQLGSLVNVLIPKINSVVDYLEKFSKSSIFKGIFKSFGKGD